MRTRIFEVARVLHLIVLLGLLAGCDLFDDDDFDLPPPGSGQVCAGIAGITCPGQLWCDLTAGSCNTADAAGVCVQVPAACTADFVPVCGCDARTYTNDCSRQMARVSKANDGPCVFARSPST